MMRTLVVFGLFATLATAAVSAEPPEGSECLGGGYEPSALVNVCTGSTEPTTVFVPVPVEEDRLCIIGGICVPSYGPSPGGGFEQEVPGALAVTYVEVLQHGVTVPPDGEAVGAIEACWFTTELLEVPTMTTDEQADYLSRKSGCTLEAVL